MRQNWEPEDQVEVRFPESAMEMPAAVQYVAQQVKVPAGAWAGYDWQGDRRRWAMRGASVAGVDHSQDVAVADVPVDHSQTGFGSRSPGRRSPFSQINVPWIAEFAAVLEPGAGRQARVHPVLGHAVHGRPCVRDLVVRDHDEVERSRSVYALYPVQFDVAGG